MALTNEYREYFLDVVSVCGIHHGRLFDALSSIVNNPDNTDKNQISTAIRNLLNRDCIKIVENAAGAPGIRLDISFLKEQNDKQDNIFNAFKQNSELQVSNLIAEVKKLTNQIIKYKTELDDTRGRLNKVSAEFDELKEKTCNYGSLNCEAIGKTFTSELDLDGLNNIIT